METKLHYDPGQIHLSAQWHFLTQNPSILLETNGPVQQKLQPGLQLQLAFQAPSPGLPEICGRGGNVALLTLCSLDAWVLLRSPLGGQRLQEHQDFEHR